MAPDAHPAATTPVSDPTPAPVTPAAVPVPDAHAHLSPFAPWPPSEPALVSLLDALPPPAQVDSPGLPILGSENSDLNEFLHDWAHNWTRLDSVPRSRPPRLDQLYKQSRLRPDRLSYADLAADRCDLQGLDWLAMDTTRRAARKRRCLTYRNYVNRFGSDLCTLDDKRLPASDNFFRFQRFLFRRDINLAHFQLRSVLACPSRGQALYPDSIGVARIQLASQRTDQLLNLRDSPVRGPISTLDANCGVLVAGTFNGHYCLRALDDDDSDNDARDFAQGQITTDFSGITNHVLIHQPLRSSSPVAAIASNDLGFRILDIETQTMVSRNFYPFALNCSALSPDRRLRVLVGDHPGVLITNADTGAILQELTGHRDFGFAADWSPDGRTVATAFQDRAIKIWDARRWSDACGRPTPLCSLRSEMAAVRCLRFSPLASGPPVLAAAEEADFINLIDARTFASKQTVDLFSEIGGLAFADDGRDLNVLCCDGWRGGLLQLRRCLGPEPSLADCALEPF